MDRKETLHFITIGWKNEELERRLLTDDELTEINRKLIGKKVVRTFKLTEPVAREAAKKLGYTVTKKTSKKAKVYKANKGPKGPKYISRDLDNHSGDVWKGAKTVKDLATNKTRFGTYDGILTRIGK